MSGTTSQLTWDRSAGLPLLLSDGGNHNIYGPGGLPIAHISSGEASTYYHHDQLGSTRMLTNSSGKATGAFSYEAYGAQAGSSGTQTTPLGYAGQYTNAQSGLQYLRARVYDPDTGQFLTRDPLIDLTGSPYGYANQSPLNGSDPTGLGPCIGGLIACDESDDPCDSPLTTNLLMPLCLVPDDASDPVTNASAGAGDSLLSPLPFIDLPINGPAIRDLLGINNVDECSFLYKTTNTVGDFASFGKGTRSISKHGPGIWRDMSRGLDQKFVNLPPDIFP